MQQRGNTNNSDANNIINSLQPINTTAPSRNFASNYDTNQSSQPYYSEPWNNADQSWHHDLFSISSLNTPTNYSEIFQQLSAPTPVTSQHLSNYEHSQNQLQTIQQTQQSTSNKSSGQNSAITTTIPNNNTISNNNSTTTNFISSNFAAADKSKKISDAQTYGPRFCEIFHTYCNDQNITVNTKRCLMSLCTEHLVRFILWARDTEERVRWISSLLFDNDYLRPEVRNGIVIVIIYTFAAIKAAHHGGDMFSVLQDTENGLGIANRFSLKIYNDPYEYLSFLKFSISSLIDAGAIPENERQNKPFKKGVTKPLPRNEQEIVAFNELSERLVLLLDEGRHTEARSFVQMITTHWQFRGNSLRTRRFSTALELVSHPNRESSTHADIAAAVYNERMQRAKEGKANENPVTTLNDIRTQQSVVLPPAPLVVQPQQQILPQTFPDPQPTLPTPASQPSQNVSMGNQFQQQQPPVQYIQVPQQTVLQKRALASTSEESGSNKRSKADGSLDEHTPISHNSNNNRSTHSHEPYAPPTAAIQPFMEREPSGLLSENSSLNSHTNAHSGSGSGGLGRLPETAGSGNLQQSGLTEGSPGTGGIRKPFSFKSLRFERIGMNEWKIKEVVIFDLGTFIQSLANFNISHVYLLNELKLVKSLNNGILKVVETNAEHEHQQRISDVFGLITLENELNKLQSILTSWQISEIPQCQHFLTSYYQHYFDTNDNNEYINNGINLYQFWYQFDPREFLFANERQSQHSSSDKQQPSTTDLSSQCDSLEAKYGINGCIGYEISNSLILIIRKNPVLGVVNDIWCKIFPNDLMHAMDEVLQSQREEDEELKKSKPTLITFGNILIYFFPQLLLLEKRLRNMNKTNHVNTLNDVFIKYYALNKIEATQTTTNNGSNNITSDSSYDTLSNGIGNAVSSSNISFGGGNNEETSIPPLSNYSSYQTIGTFSTPARKVMARLQSGAKIHDFLLEVDPNDM